LFQLFSFVKFNNPVFGENQTKKKKKDFLTKLGENLIYAKIQLFGCKKSLLDSAN